MTDEEVLQSNFEWYENIFTSNKIFQFNFHEHSTTPTVGLFHKFTTRKLTYIEDTEFGNLYTHNFEGFQIDIFVDSKNINYIVTYFKKAWTIHVVNTIDIKDRWKRVGDTFHILEKYYQPRFKIGYISNDINFPEWIYKKYENYFKNMLFTEEIFDFNAYHTLCFLNEIFVRFLKDNLKCLSNESFGEIFQLESHGRVVDFFTKTGRLDVIVVRETETTSGETFLTLKNEEFVKNIIENFYFKNYDDFQREIGLRNLRENLLELT